MVASKKKSDFATKLFEAHAKQLQRTIDKAGVIPLRKLYRSARGDLYDRLLSAGPSSQKITPTVLRAMIGQTQGALELLGSELQGTLKSSSRLAAELGGRHAIDEFIKLEQHFKGTTPVLNLEEAAIFKGMIDDVEPSLLRRHRLLSQSWSLGATHRIEERLAIGAMTQKPLHEMVADVMQAGGIVEEESWRAERIVRTELAYSAGATKFEAIQRTEEELGEPLYKKLIATFDDRTGDDSYLQHGAVVPLDKPFKWKHKVGGKWVVTEYMYPPNRPNDREIMIPWDKSWEESDEEKPLSKSDLEAVPPTRWRKKVGVEVPPGR